VERRVERRSLLRCSAATLGAALPSVMVRSTRPAPKTVAESQPPSPAPREGRSRGRRGTGRGKGCRRARCTRRHRRRRGLVRRAGRRTGSRTRLRAVARFAAPAALARGPQGCWGRGQPPHFELGVRMRPAKTAPYLPPLASQDARRLGFLPVGTPHPLECDRLLREPVGDFAPPSPGCFNPWRSWGSRSGPVLGDPCGGWLPVYVAQGADPRCGSQASPR
jgi:hypothetical protein